MRYVALAVLTSGLCSAQNSTQPDELQFLRHILLNVASLDHDSGSIKAFEDSLAKQFGLTPQESSAIHAIGQTLTPILDQQRRSSQDIVRGKRSLSQGDINALHDLDMQREEKITERANQILSSVSAATADRLRRAGNILAAATKK